MPSKTLSFAATALRRLWWLLDASRRALLNLLLLVLLVALVWVLLRAGPPTLQPKTALVLDIAGRVVEQRTGSSRDGVLRQLSGRESDETRLRDVLAVLEAAAKDDKISHALLMVDGLSAAGLPTLREVAAAIERFKAAGKPVIAWGSEFDQRPRRRKTASPITSTMRPRRASRACATSATKLQGQGFAYIKP